MAVPVPYTTGYDKVLSVLRILTGLCWMILCVGVVIFIAEEIGIKSITVGPKWLSTILSLLFFIVLPFALAIYLHKITTAKLLFNLSAYLYVRHTLKTKISWKNVSKVSWLFTPNESGKWYPMKEVLQLPEGERENYLFRRANEIYRHIKEEQA